MNGYLIVLEVSEWGEILDEIVFALRYDCGQIGGDVIIPSHGEQEHIKSYLSANKNDYDRYRRGCRLLGLYYGDLKNKLTKYGKNIALQGELIGSGINGNLYGMKDHALYFFTGYDIDKGRRMFFDELVWIS